MGEATPKIAFIQILRGLAALIVVWAHLSGYWLFLTATSTPLQDVWVRWVTTPFHLNQNGGFLGVLVFFLISGYIITHTSLREGRLTFFVKRWFRIFPVLFVAIAVTWGVVQLIVSFHLPLLGMQQGSVWAWLQAAFLIDGFRLPAFMLSPTWTLIIEVMFYVLVFAMLTRQKTKPLASTWLMIALWLIASVTFMNVPYLSSHQNALSVFFVGFLIIGRLIYFAQRRLIPMSDAFIAGTVTFMATCGLFEAASPGYLLAPGGWKGFEPVVSFILAIIIFLAFLRMAPVRATKPFAFLGDISYSLYLLHFPVGFLVLTVLQHFAVMKTLSFFISLAVVIALSYVSYRWVEKPMQRLARRILRSNAVVGGSVVPILNSDHSATSQTP
jgi:peptidoglycan/LPS O-acetylase OafA/YrhL